jgi:hypothetical protein
MAELFRSDKIWNQHECSRNVGICPRRSNSSQAVYQHRANSGHTVVSWKGLPSGLEHLDLLIDFSKAGCNELGHPAAGGKPTATPIAS